MKRLLILTAAAGLLLGMAASGVPSFADQGNRGSNGSPNLRASLSGYQEVPAVSTGASGSFRAKIAPDEESVEWTLSWAGLEAATTQAHIHFGTEHVNGGVTVWLCSNLASPPTPAGVQACAGGAGSVSGTFNATHVVGPAAQGIAPGQLEELITALRRGVAYANVHSTTFPGGEIRGQIG